MKSIGTVEGVVDAEFGFYTGFHKQRSSTVALLPVDGIVRKSKPKRFDENSLREYYSLSIWYEMLKAHGNPQIPVVSPFPIAIDREAQIYMSFIPGVTGGAVVSNNFPDELGLSKVEKKHRCRDFMVRLGRLLAIKELECIVHGDFQLRHLLYSISRSTLGVIDVENSGKVSPFLVKRENQTIQDALVSRMPSSGNWRRKYLDGIDEGRASMDGIYSQIDAIADQVRLSLGVSSLNFGSL